jgi:hypothetical protein
MAAVAAALASFLTASAMPYAATWHRETLIGENGSCHVLLVSEHINEGTYYRSRESQRIERIDKRSGKTIETLPIREVDFVSDMQTWAPSIEERSMTAFDLAAYAAAHHLSAPFARDLEPMAELDSTGLVVRSDGRSEIIVPMATIRARFVPSGEPDAPKLVGIEFTSARPDSGLGVMQYYRILSYTAGSDISSSEVVIMVPKERIKQALERFVVPTRRR